MVTQIIIHWWRVVKDALRPLGALSRRRPADCTQDTGLEAVASSKDAPGALFIYHILLFLLTTHKWLTE